MRSMHFTARQTARVASMDIMRPAAAFAIRRSWRPNDAARWLRTVLALLALAAAYLVVSAPADQGRGVTPIAAPTAAPTAAPSSLPTAR